MMSDPRRTSKLHLRVAVGVPGVRLGARPLVAVGALVAEEGKGQLWRWRANAFVVSRLSSSSPDVQYEVLADPGLD
jgi:hypothetical protein